jgi:hypothetical protein
MDFVNLNKNPEEEEIINEEKDNLRLSKGL